MEDAQNVALTPEERRTYCLNAVNTALIKYNCTLTASVLLEAGNNQFSVKVVSLPDKPAETDQPATTPETPAVPVTPEEPLPPTTQSTPTTEPTAANPTPAPENAPELPADTPLGNQAGEVLPNDPNNPTNANQASPEPVVEPTAPTEPAPTN